MHLSVLFFERLAKDSFCFYRIVLLKIQVKCINPGLRITQKAHLGAQGFHRLIGGKVHTHGIHLLISQG